MLSDSPERPGLIKRLFPGEYTGLMTLTSTDSQLRVLVIGTLPPFIGGTTILLSQLVKSLSVREDIHLSMLNTAKKHPGPIGSLIHIAVTVLRVLKLGSCVDVITFHMNEPQKGLVIWFLACLLRKPLLVRWFGGTNYRTYGSLIRRLSACETAV